MLLSKTNVLDKGFVAPLEFTGNGRMLQELQDTYFKTKTHLGLLKLSTASLVIKCPLFVQLNLSKYGLDIITTPSDDIEAYIPDLSMVSGDSLEDRKRMVQYMNATTEALLLNQKGMKMDGGDEFTAQLLTPITVYNELVVNGKLQTWLAYLSQKGLPKEAELYRKTIEDILKTERKNISALLNV
jgi:hypothetical protein